MLYLELSAAFINQSNVQKSKSRKKEIRTVRWSKKSQVRKELTLKQWRPDILSDNVSK